MWRPTESAWYSRDYARRRESDPAPPELQASSRQLVKAFQGVRRPDPLVARAQDARQRGAHAPAADREDGDGFALDVKVGVEEHLDPDPRRGLARATSEGEWRYPTEAGSILCTGQLGLLCATNPRTPDTKNPTQVLAGSPSGALADGD